MVDFYGSLVLSIDTGGGETYTVIPADKIKVQAFPFLRGKKPVIELVDGTRIVAASEAKWHIDVEIEWAELGSKHYTALGTWIETAFPVISTATYIFYPVANSAGTAPDGGYSGFEVVPEFTGELLQAIFEDRIRKRGAKLKLKSTTPVPTASLPTWLSS